MLTTTVAIIAVFTIMPEQTALAETTLSALVEPSRQETGCLAYALWQSASHPNQFTFVEQWRSMEALEAHKETPHFTAAMQALQPYFSQAPEVTVYRPLA